MKRRPSQGLDPWTPKQWEQAWGMVAKLCWDVSHDDPRYEKIQAEYLAPMDQLYAMKDEHGFSLMLERLTLGFPEKAKS